MEPQRTYRAPSPTRNRPPNDHSSPRSRTVFTSSSLLWGIGSLIGNRKQDDEIDADSDSDSDEEKDGRRNEHGSRNASPIARLFTSLTRHLFPSGAYALPFGRSTGATGCSCMRTNDNPRKEPSSRSSLEQQPLSPSLPREFSGSTLNKGTKRVQTTLSRRHSRVIRDLRRCVRAGDPQPRCSWLVVEGRTSFPKEEEALCTVRFRFRGAS